MINDEDLFFDFSGNASEFSNTPNQYELEDYAQRIQDGLNSAERRAQAHLLEVAARLKLQEIKEKTEIAELKMQEQAIVDAMLYLDQQEKSTRRSDFIAETERMLEEQRRKPLPRDGYTI